MFRINACSLNLNFVHLQDLLIYKNKNFEIIAITGTKTTRNVSPTSNLGMNNFFLSSESSADRILIYIANHLSRG